MKFNFRWFFCLLVVVSVLSQSCGSKSSDQPRSYINPAFAEYISSYTAGTVPSGATLKIVLTHDVADSAQLGREVDTKLFDFSPGIKGKVFWADARTIEFRPDNRLQSGQVYEVKFALSKVVEVSNDLSSFVYSFQVIPQNFEVVVENVKPYTSTELDRQKIEGYILTADYSQPEWVEKIISASQQNQSQSVTWTHSADGRQHGFIIENIKRGEKASVVKLTANGKSIGVDRTDEREIEIPALGDFKVTQVRVVQNPTQHVILQFSDPLKQKQNLQGLVIIAGVNEVDFDIRDNEIWVYPSSRQAGTKTIRIESGIRNVLDYKMNSGTTWDVLFEQLKPEVKLTGKGVILPSTDGMVLPFEAVNLKAVDVRVTRIYENNILQFLQVNDLNGQSELRRVGKQVSKSTINLESTGVTDLGKWNRYTLDLSKIISAEPGALYQVKLSFKKSYSTFICESEERDADELTVDSWEEPEYENDYGDYYDYYDYYDYEYYDWEQRDNPCHTSYYTNNRIVTRNILASDIGLLAKQGSDGNTHIFATDLLTAQSLSGVQLEIYNYQQQLLATASTSADGKAVIATTENPYAIIAKQGAQRGYLTLHNGRSLSLSSFDVSGEQVQKGLKGFLYGERGVWRPGDSLYLTFIIEDKNKILPQSHPVIMELYNPQGQLATRLVRSSSENGFYNFATATKPDDPTGNWSAKVKVGGTEFSQTVKIETVKPNRLKINLDFGVEKITTQNLTGTLDIKWLHGAPGRNLKAEFDVTLSRATTSFPKFTDYIFEDPSREFYSEAEMIFEGYTDAEGKATVNASLASSYAAPGFLTAVFRGKAYEESGNFSIDRFSLPYYPYESYVGIKVPKGERYSGILYLDSTHSINVATLAIDGSGVSRDVDVSLYKLEWRWWWDNSYGSLANYVSGSYNKPIKNEKVKTVNGKGTWKFKIQSPDWGRYFVRMCDPVSGHCTGKIIYIDEPGWYSRMRGDDSRSGATMLSFSSDKEVYSIGDKINLSIPGSSAGRALISVETGSKVLQTYWIDTQAGETKFAIDAIPTMTPNIFIHVTLLQPHAQTVNDLPIRLYGVIPIRVEDPQTHLEPVISMPEVIEPGEKVTIKVSEKSKRKMTYTVAMVDEGLLDITRFKTPDAWKRFYAREALGVRTWDLYDDVMGSFGSRIERLLAVGGDAELAAKQDDPRANRFKPVVKFFGPFTLEKGKTASHTFTMPNYIGSVKTMVVAGYEGAYGNAERITPVRKPLMVLATLPRVLGPQESLRLPITLFTQEKSIKNVKIEIKTSGPVSVTGQSTQQVSMNATGDMTIDFGLSVKDEIGVAVIDVTASSGSYQATDRIEIDVRNPNQSVTRVQEAVIEAGKSWNADAVPFGIKGTNSATLEVSTIPPVDLGSRLRYLIQYPYGCVEQTTSAVFPQLYLDQVRVLTENEKAATQRNVTLAIERLKSFVQRDGGFSYWPGTGNADEWGTTYAGHFLIEAEAKGYYVPAEVIRNWRQFQKRKALEWRRNEYYNSDLMQAYRLYVLALSGAPELSAMNRMREMTNVSATAKWMLAAAYAKVSQPEAAKKLIESLPTAIKQYRELGYSYGSDVRDKALIIETLVLLQDKTKAFELVKELSAVLSNSGYWMSTQEVAFSLKAIAAFAATDKRDDMKYKYAINGKGGNIASQLPISQQPIAMADNKRQSLSVTNTGNSMLFVRVLTTGTPARGDELAEENNLNVTIKYTDNNGNVIDPMVLEQGTQFIAEVSVTHPGVRGYYSNMALNQIFPSGWEINNLRLDQLEQTLTNSAFTYQDIRDDRVYTYFDIGPRTTKTFRVSLTATYAGTYYLPGVSCEAMYDRSIYARTVGYEVQVIKPQVQ